MKLKCAVCGIGEGQVKREHITDIMSDPRLVSILRKKKWVLKNHVEGSDTPILQIVATIFMEDEEIGQRLIRILSPNDCCLAAIEKEIESIKTQEEDAYSGYAGLCC